MASKACLPAGSFKCERLVKSSEASNIVGFMSGGSFGSLPSAMAASVVSIDLVCSKQSAPNLV
jgi:hypothetical protein